MADVGGAVLGSAVSTLLDEMLAALRLVKNGSRYKLCLHWFMECLQPSVKQICSFVQGEKHPADKWLSELLEQLKRAHALVIASDHIVAYEFYESMLRWCLQFRESQEVCASIQVLVKEAEASILQWASGMSIQGLSSDIHAKTLAEIRTSLAGVEEELQIIADHLSAEEDILRGCSKLDQIPSFENVGESSFPQFESFCSIQTQTNPCIQLFLDKALKFTTSVPRWRWYTDLRGEEGSSEFSSSREWERSRSSELELFEAKVSTLQTKFATHTSLLEKTSLQNEDEEMLKQLAIEGSWILDVENEHLTKFRRSDLPWPSESSCVTYGLHDRAFPCKLGIILARFESILNTDTQPPQFNMDMSSLLNAGTQPPLVNINMSNFLNRNRTNVLPFGEDSRYVPIVRVIGEVRKALDEYRVVTVCGEPGLGKTGLVKYVALHYQSHTPQRSRKASSSAAFPDKVYFLRCGRDKIEQLQHNLLQSLGCGSEPVLEDIPEKREGDFVIVPTVRKSVPTVWQRLQDKLRYLKDFVIVPTVRKRLQDKLRNLKALIILDDVWERSVLEELILSPNEARSVKYLLTSQIIDIWPNAKAIPMERPNLEEARQILQNYTSGLFTETSFPENIQVTANSIIRDLDFHPLALANLALGFRQQDSREPEAWRAVKDLWEQEPPIEQLYKPLIYGKRYPFSLYEAMVRVIDLLDDAARDLLFLMCGLNHSRVPETAVRYLYECAKLGTGSGYEHDVNCLRNLSLVEMSSYHYDETPSQYDRPVLRRTELVFHRLRALSIRSKYADKVRDLMGRALKPLKEMYAHHSAETTLIPTGYDDCASANFDDGLLNATMVGMYGDKRFWNAAIVATILRGGLFPNYNLFETARGKEKSLRPMVDLLLPDPTVEEWNSEAGMCAKKIIVKFVWESELDDESVGRLIQFPGTRDIVLSFLKTIFQDGYWRTTFFQHSRTFSSAHSRIACSLSALVHDDATSSEMLDSLVGVLFGGDHDVHGMLDYENDDTIIKIGGGLIKEALGKNSNMGLRCFRLLRSSYHSRVFGVIEKNNPDLWKALWILRVDVKSLGFTNFNQEFDGRNILILYHVRPNEKSLDMVFFHDDGMANLIGVGLPFGKISIIQDSEFRIEIHEISENSWRALWAYSSENSLQSFQPIIIDCKALQARNISEMFKDRAGFEFPSEAESVEECEFLGMRAEKDDHGSPLQWWPDWIQMLQSDYERRQCFDVTHPSRSGEYHNVNTSEESQRRRDTSQVGGLSPAFLQMSVNASGDTNSRDQQQRQSGNDSERGSETLSSGDSPLRGRPNGDGHGKSPHNQTEVGSSSSDEENLSKKEMRLVVKIFFDNECEIRREGDSGTAGTSAAGLGASNASVASTSAGDAGEMGPGAGNSGVAGPSVDNAGVVGIGAVNGGVVGSGASNTSVASTSPGDAGETCPGAGNSGEAGPTVDNAGVVGSGASNGGVAGSGAGNAGVTGPSASNDGVRGLNEAGPRGRGPKRSILPKWLRRGGGTDTAMPDAAMSDTAMIGTTVMDTATTSTAIVDENSSCIDLQMEIEFLCTVGNWREIDVKFCVDFQMDGGSTEEDRFGWHQNDLTFSFNCKDKHEGRDAVMLDKKHSKILSECVPESTTRTKNDEKTTSDTHGTSKKKAVQGSGGFNKYIHADFTYRREWDDAHQTTQQSKETDQVQRSLSRNCLADARVFAIANKTVKNHMKYMASLHPEALKCIERPYRWLQAGRYEASQLGMFSTVGIEAQARWELLGAGNKTHVFEARKTLTMYSKGVGDAVDSREKCLQVLTKNFKVNHSFSYPDFNRWKREEPYRWMFWTPCPVPVAPFMEKSDDE